MPLSFLVTSSQIKASPGSAVPWPLRCACHPWNSPGLHLGVERPLLEKQFKSKGIFLFGALVIKYSMYGGFFPPHFCGCFLPLTSWNFHWSRFLLSGTSTPPPAKSKEPCCSSPLRAGPTFAGSTPSLHFREWPGYTFSWSSGRYYFRGPELGKKTKTIPELRGSASWHCLPAGCFLMRHFKIQIFELQIRNRLQFPERNSWSASITQWVSHRIAF